MVASGPIDGMTTGKRGWLVAGVEERLSSQLGGT